MGSAVFNDIATREKLMSAMGNVSGEAAPASRVPFVAGAIYGSEQARLTICYRSQKKHTRTFRTSKRFGRFDFLTLQRGSP